MELKRQAAEHTRRQRDPSRFIELVERLRQASPADRAVLDEMLALTLWAQTMNERYSRAVVELFKPGVKREKRLENAGKVMLDAASASAAATARLQQLGADYEMLTNGTVSEARKAFYEHWRWEDLERIAHRRPKGLERSSGYIGEDFSVPKGCQSGEFVFLAKRIQPGALHCRRYSLRRRYKKASQVRIAALMALTAAHGFDNAEACLQHLKRAKTADYIKTKLPAGTER